MNTLLSHEAMREYEMMELTQVDYLLHTFKLYT